MSTIPSPSSRTLDRSKQTLRIALPAPELQLDQNEEWLLVEMKGKWCEVRFHDYPEMFSIPGLYDKVIYEIMGCKSPEVVGHLLERELREEGVDPETLTVLDLGAGPGQMAEVLADFGVKNQVGLDLIPEAKEAAERDRPGLYIDYAVTDITDPTPQGERVLSKHTFNCLTCVAALGYGDIPPEAFAAAFNRIEDGGWIAFTIKSDFVKDADHGFAKLINDAINDGTMEILKQEEYQHRVNTTQDPLLYTAFIGRKTREMPVG